MSKKMLKRSLALGALMAFVITGSAMSVAEATYYAQAKGEEAVYSDIVPEQEAKQRVLGGWDNPDRSKDENAKDTLNSKLTVTGGNWNGVVGGHWVRDLKTSDELQINVASTNTLIKDATVRMVVGGSAAVNYQTLNYNGNGTYNLKIESGTFGHPGYEKNANVPELFVAGGDLVKYSTVGSVINDNKLAVSMKSTVKETNVEILDGTFDSAIIGGSVAMAYYNPVKKATLEASVGEANVLINGGTFNHAIIAGGFAWGQDALSKVDTANLEISGTSSKLVINDNIYSGGMRNEKNALGTATVGVANLNINDAVVKDIYGTGAILRNLASGNDSDWEYVQNPDAVVNTNLSLTNVTANTIDLPKGTLTLAGTNNVNNITIGADVTEVNIASKALAEGSSLTGDGKGDLKVEGKETALTITGITAGTYNIASGYANNEANKFVFNQEDELLDAKAVFEDGVYKVEVTAKSANDIANKLETTESTGNFVKDIITEGNDEATEFLDKLMESDATNAVINDTLAAVQKMGEAGGNSATAANIVKNVTGVTNDRLSFNCGHSAPHKGGHGVGLFEEGSGADIWVEYVHGKDEVEDMPSTAGASSYEGQYNGIVMGVDFKKVGKFQSGIAFNYGEGDTNSVGSLTRTHSDYDFWGVGYYGNIHNDDSNVIFDINYAQTDSDVTQSSAAGALEASPETTTWSAGVKLEKLYQNENVQIVPYTGLRYMSIDSDDYATKGGGFMYNMERQNIWLLPVGVSIRQEIANDNGWTVSPRVDLSYIWAFGDTNSNMEVKVGNGITPIGYDVMDDGSFLGLVGIEAHKGQWGYGVAYSYQKGDHSESKKWYVDVNYSF